MSSTYTGTGTTIHTAIALLDDSDRPSAQLWRQSFEPIIDSLAALGTGTGVGVTAIRTTGGTFTLTANVVIEGGGFEWRFNDTVRLMAGAALELNSTSGIAVNSGAGIGIDSGGFMSVDGSIEINSGGVFTVEEGGLLEIGTGAGLADLVVRGSAVLTLLSGAVLEVSNGGKIHGSAGGEIDVASSDDIVINGTTGVAFSARHSLRAQQITLVAGVPTWQPFSGSSGIWVDTVGDRGVIVLDALKILPGDVLTSVSVRVTGQVGASAHAAVPATPLRVEVFTIDTNGAVTSVHFEDDPSGSTGAYNVPHTITLTGGSLPLTVGNAPVYVRVLGEDGAGAEADKTAILSMSVNGVAHKFRNTVEFA